MSHISYEWQIFIGYLKGSILIVGLPVFWKLVLARFPVCPGIKTVSYTHLDVYKRQVLEECRGYTALYGRVHDEEGDIDEAIALNFIAPASFTGEDVVELSCHGGIYVMRRVLQAVLAAGAAPAGPGEFTRRAFLNGKLGLTEAESVMQIISAQGLEAGKAAMAGRDGALERRIRKIRAGLTAVAAHLDACLLYTSRCV